MSACKDLIEIVIATGRSFLEILTAFGFCDTEAFLGCFNYESKGHSKTTVSILHAVGICFLLCRSFRLGYQQVFDTFYCTFVQNDITAVTKEGKILLANLEVPDTEESISSRLEHHEQISGDWQTVNK